MRAVHFGAGNIGRGFIGELLFNSGYKISFIELNKDIIDYINKDNSYEIYIIGNEHEKNYKEIIKNVKAYSPITDENKVIEEIYQADIITTSVCIDNVKKIVPILVKGLKKRLFNKKEKINIMACENAFHASDILKKELLSNKIEPFSEEQLNKIASFPNVVVDRIALGKLVGKIIIPQVQCMMKGSELIIEKNKLVLPDEIIIKEAQYVENIDMYLERKFYLFNCGHAATAYFGYLHNFDVLPIAKARGFWDTDEPCYQKTVLRVLSAMDNALPILLLFIERRKFFLPLFLYL